MKNLKKLHLKIMIAAAIIGIMLGVVLKGIQIHNELAQPTRVTAPTATPMPHKTVYSFSLSGKVVIDKKK